PLLGLRLTVGLIRCHWCFPLPLFFITVNPLDNHFSNNVLSIAYKYDLRISVERKSIFAGCAQRRSTSADALVIKPTVFDADLLVSVFTNIILKSGGCDGDGTRRDALASSAGEWVAGQLVRLANHLVSRVSV